MKCPRCGFVAHGNLEKCRRCGVRFVFRKMHETEGGGANLWTCKLCNQGRRDSSPRFSRTVEREDAQFVILQASATPQAVGLSLVALHRPPPFVLAPICSECYDFLDGMGKRCLDASRLKTAAPFIERAVRLEEEGRYAEATQSYEIAGRWRDAARTREQSRGLTVRFISVDLTDIMSDLRREGLNLDYTCMSCGTSWKIDGYGHDPWQSSCPSCNAGVDELELLKSLRSLDV